MALAGHPGAADPDDVRLALAQLSGIERVRLDAVLAAALEQSLQALQLERVGGDQQLATALEGHAVLRRRRRGSLRHPHGRTVP